ncbi:MAG: exo-alpha-sialidase [Labilibaculum antarcticum]
MTKRTLSYLIIFSIFSCASIFAQEKIKIKNITKEFIFNIKPTNNCHAATLEEVSTDTIMAAWFGGTYEGAKDVGIYLSKFDGEKWSEPYCQINPIIQNKDTLPCWNPVLFKSQSQCLYLFYKIGENPREWFGAMITSQDNGKTWSKTKYLPKNILGPIRNKPIEISPGIIICGSSTESTVDNKWRVHLEIFNEENRTWKKVKVKNTSAFDVIQPTFITHPNQKIQMLCRSKHNTVISSWSLNGGESWSDLDSIPVVNSNSGIDALTINDSLFLLVNNPLKQGTNWFNGRNVLDVEYSKNGIIWNKLIDLENQEKGEFSYPAIIQTSNQKIHILYTYNREFIKHISFNISPD